MAALPAGVQYGLSSESSCKEDKELVFVKLTDSALNAIRDYLKKDRLAKAKIQFLPGNEGKICIPVPPSGNGPSGEATFHFNISSNTEIEGPQGSFECVRSGGARRLESCGPLPRRMRVLANDDSYEATKDRMARTVAAEQSKCTRVIKPNQTDIGRRVKVRSAHPYSTTPAAAQIAERLERAERERSDRVERPERPERVERPERPERPDRSDRPDRPERPDRPVAPTLTPRPTQPAHQPTPVPLQNPPAQRPPSNPDIGRRSLKERLIQLLALKPFKKPELYTRLISEGLKDRTAVGKILPQISTLKDNCYHLRRHFWNDVNEDWPFYSEEEKRMLKRRKPQNLTPPLSSDSANSLSPRASPSASKRASGATSSEEAPAAKKQRISHYRRPSPPSSGYATTSSGERHASDNEDDRSTETAKKEDKGYILNFTTVKELGESPVKNGIANGYRGSPVEQTKNGYRSSPPVEQTKNGYRSSPPVEQTKNGYRSSPPVEQTKNGYRNSPPVEQAKNGYRNSPPVEQTKNGYRNSPPVEQAKNGYRNSPPVEQTKNGYRNSPPVEQTKNGYRSSPLVEQSNITETNITNSEPTTVPSTADLTNINVNEENANDTEEIERLYPPITNGNMRRSYKNEFAELYTEYRAVYERVARVANLFTRLEGELQRAAPASPHHQSIEQRIVEEYRRVNNDVQYQNDRQRVNYLHRKLNHIKRMVHQYDQPRNLKQQERVSTASTTQAY